MENSRYLLESFTWITVDIYQNPRILYMESCKCKCPQKGVQTYSRGHGIPVAVQESVVYYNCIDTACCSSSTAGHGLVYRHKYVQLGIPTGVYTAWFPCLSRAWYPSNSLFLLG